MSFKSHQIIKVITYVILCLSFSAYADEKFPVTIYFQTSPAINEDLSIDKIVCTGNSGNQFNYCISGIANKDLTNYQAAFYYQSKNDEREYIGNFSFPDFIQGKSFSFNIRFYSQEVMPKDYIGFLIKKYDEIDIPEINVDVEIIDDEDYYNENKSTKISIAVEDPNKRIIDDRIYAATEERPLFPGGDASMIQWISKNIHYPESAVKNNVSCQILVRVVVEKDGTITNPSIQKGKNEDLNKEAIRIVTNMPRWKAGKMNGLPVRSYVTIPIRFKAN